MYLIAVVEDSPTDILLFRMALDHAGIQYEMREFTEGREALDFLSHDFLSQGERPDLIVTDGVVPGVDIEEFLAAIKKSESLAGVPVIVMSGMQDLQFEQRVKANGAEDYIVKAPNLQGWWAIGERLKRAIEKFRQAESGA